MNRLEVFIPTFFTEIPQPSKIILEANSPNSKSLELRCKAISDKRLNIDYIWTKNGHPILIKNEEEKIEIITEEDGTSILRLFNLNGYNSGRIECSAITEVDVKSTFINLIVKDVPERPELMRVDCSSGRYALLIWKRPLILINNPLTAFIVEAKTEKNSENWEKVFEEYLGGEEEIANGGPKILHKTAIPLRPWNNYTFRLFSINLYGRSQPSPSMPIFPFKCYSPPDIPFKNPSNVIAEGNKPNNLIIRWNPLPKEYWNAPGLNYLIRYRRKLNLNETKWKELLIEDPFANQTIIREQPTFVPYQVQVRAINSLGFSVEEPLIIEGWSGEDIPLEEPKNLHLLIHNNYSSVTLEWDKHLENSSIRGHFRGYRIDYWLDIYPFYINSIYSLSNNQIINGLKALNYYIAKVHLLNNNYESKSSNLLKFQTIEGIPSKVHNLRIHSVGSYSILITWEPPQHLNGNLRGYFITFQNGITEQIEETYILHRQLFYLNEQLIPNTPYRISVWAETGGGEDLNKWLLSKWITLPQTSFELKELKEDTEYIIIGIAKEGTTNLFSYSKPLIIKTENSKIISIFNKERIRTAAWFLSVLIVSIIILLISCLMCLLYQRNSRGIINLIKLREKKFGQSFRIDSDNLNDLSSEEINSSSSSNYLIMKPRNKIIINNKGN
ncbi:hypothetical protein Mgra_00002441 [Meloidogyne graminicola]|uniref:Uncharacterized protein n=1 Tax=Meloidogyne graminicola TaxID=189291 RepID=A0A8S9ZX26_9BILA|nr:hypothetical protein Mgra_00002441 [Meloidogyne graminicola]